MFTAIVCSLVTAGCDVVPPMTDEQVSAAVKRCESYGLHAVITQHNVDRKIVSIACYPKDQTL